VVLERLAGIELLSPTGLIAAVRDCDDAELVRARQFAVDVMNGLASLHAALSIDGRRDVAGLAVVDMFLRGPDYWNRRASVVSMCITLMRALTGDELANAAAIREALASAALKYQQVLLSSADLDEPPNNSLDSEDIEI
jgi:hypothetical protein